MKLYIAEDEEWIRRGIKKDDTLGRTVHGTCGRSGQRCIGKGRDTEA